MEAQKKFAKPAGLQEATTSDLRAAVAHLRKVQPLPIPVEVRMNLPYSADCWGVASIVKTPASVGPFGKLIAPARKRFTIQLVPGMPLAMLHMVLVHEWAHLLDWRPDAPFRTHHCATFGVHWAEVHCDFFETG